MTAIIILALLCLAAASLILRVIVSMMGRDHGRLAKIASIVGSIGFSPLIAFEWVINLAMACLLILMLDYWIASGPVTDFLKEGASEPSRKTETQPDRLRSGDR